MRTASLFAVLVLAACPTLEDQAARNFVWVDATGAFVGNTEGEFGTLFVDADGLAWLIDRETAELRPPVEVGEKFQSDDCTGPALAPAGTAEPRRPVKLLDGTLASRGDDQLSRVITPRSSRFDECVPTPNVSEGRFVRIDEMTKLTKEPPTLAFSAPLHRELR